MPQVQAKPDLACVGKGESCQLLMQKQRVEASNTFSSGCFLSRSFAKNPNKQTREKKNTSVFLENLIIVLTIVHFVILL